MRRRRSRGRRPPEKFEDEARGRVKQRVGEDDLTLEVLTPGEPREEKKEGETDRGFVELHRVQLDAERRAADARGIRVSEGDRPCDARGAAVVVAGHEAADAAYGAWPRAMAGPQRSAARQTGNSGCLRK